MGCCGNGVSKNVRWWRGFPTRKLFPPALPVQKPPPKVPADNLFQCLSTDGCSLCCPLYRSARSSMDSAEMLWLHFRHSVAVFWFASDAKNALKSNFSGQSAVLRRICRNLIGLAFQTTSQMWLGSDLQKIAFHEVFCCPDFLKSIWIQSGYARKQIWAGSVNKAVKPWEHPSLWPCLPCLSCLCRHFQEIDRATLTGTTLS